MLNDQPLVTSNWQLGGRVLLAILLLSSLALAVAKAPVDPTDLAVALKSGKPVIVKLGADWCPPCRAMKPELAALKAETKGKMIVLDLDIQKNRQLAGKHKVSLIPTTLFYNRSGQFRDKKTGFMSKAELLKSAQEFGLIK